MIVSPGIRYVTVRTPQGGEQQYTEALSDDMPAFQPATSPRIAYFAVPFDGSSVCVDLTGADDPSVPIATFELVDGSLVASESCERQLVTVLAALIMAVFLASLDTTIISTALPTIAGQFNAFESFAWVGTAYIVTSTIATPLLGKLSDIYGRRLIFQFAMAVFLVGSVLCGLAQSMGQLIGFRALQGLGGGAIQAL
eukprot:gene33511-56146_t